jgi:hypothetical protein
MKRVLVGIAALILFALLAVDIYLRLQPPRFAPAPTPSPAPSASPAPTATPADTPLASVTPTAAPVPVEEVMVVPTPAVVADAKPPAPVPGAGAAPKPTRAATRKPPIRPRPAPPAVTRPDAAPAARRTFVSGETIFATGPTGAEASLSSGSDVPRGFDPGGVAVKAAPKVPAFIEFDVSPTTLKPGDPYTVRIFVRNQGKKVIKIRELRVASTLNGVRSESAVTPKIKDVPPELSALVAEVPSVWRPDVRDWTLEVALRSAHGDVYKNTVAWR